MRIVYYSLLAQIIETFQTIPNSADIYQSSSIFLNDPSSPKFDELY